MAGVEAVVVRAAVMGVLFIIGSSLLGRPRNSRRFLFSPAITSDTVRYVTGVAIVLAVGMAVTL